MRKLLVSIFLAVTLSILVSLPGSAEVTTISPGDWVYSGEEDLDLTDAMGDYEMIAHWFPGEDPDVGAPDKILDVPNPQSVYINPKIVYGYVGNWYQWDGKKRGDLVFIVSDPSLRVDVYDTTAQKDVTNMAVPRGHYINFKIITNIGSVSERSGYSSEDGPINLIIMDPEGNNITESVIGKDDQLIPFHTLPVTPVKNDEHIWYWVGKDGDHNVPSPDDGWNTGARDDSGNFVYDTGEYTIQAECVLNGMNTNYLTVDGSPYTGRTISAMKTITLTDGDEQESSSESSSKADNTAKAGGIVSSDTKDYSPNTGTL